jgi:hypothetical protein
MTANKKVCISDGNENVFCPNCGKVMPTVEYFTAKPISQEVRQQNYNTQQIITTYTDIVHHFGNICLSCAYDNEKKKRTIGLILLIGGGILSFGSMLTGLVLSTLAQNNGGDVGAALGLPMALMCVFLILAVFGIAIFLGAESLRPNRIRSKEQLYVLFERCIKKEAPQAGIVYLSPWLAAQLKNK